MLWKLERILPDSLPVARKRLVPLLKKREERKGYFEMYQKNVDDYVKNGYTKKLTPDETVKRTW